MKEAKKWAKRDIDFDGLDIYEPLEAPQLSSSILALIDRVEGLDEDSIRLNSRTDQKMIGGKDGRRNFKIGRRALLALKEATGISRYRMNRSVNKELNKFNKFKKYQIQKNRPNE